MSTKPENRHLGTHESLELKVRVEVDEMNRSTVSAWRE
jgi:hypothetical protein